jgi:Myotubularin-like phosphatase domain
MAIMRCSQPNVGPNIRRCKEDEVVVNSAVGIGRRGYILDTRSQNIVKLATAKGQFDILNVLPLTALFVACFGPVRSCLILPNCLKVLQN